MQKFITKKLDFPMIYNPWKFQSPSLYQWKDIAIYLKTNFAYFSVPWEGDFGFGALGGRGNPPDPPLYNQICSSRGPWQSAHVIPNPLEMISLSPSWTASVFHFVK